MSKNFELLRKVTNGQVLFGQGAGYSPIISEPAVRLNEARIRDDSARSGTNVAQAIESTASGLANEVIKLVRNVFVFPNSHAPRLVCFSSIERSGSAEISLRASQTLADQGTGTVCLVDANVHAPSVHRLLGIERVRGLVDAMAEPGAMKDYAVSTGHKNLWVVPSGVSVGSEMPALFALGRLRSRILELKEKFDFVLIDGPPVSLDGDAALLGQMTDGLILVLEANSTRRETARMAKENLDKAKVKILGAVLNNRSFPIPEILYRKL